jgi:hypothetical protein
MVIEGREFDLICLLHAFSRAILARGPFRRGVADCGANSDQHLDDSGPRVLLTAHGAFCALAGGLQAFSYAYAVGEASSGFSDGSM